MNAGAVVGCRLAAARATHNLSVSDIARQLKLSLWQIEALEADRYEQLPSAVFVRGFIRNYARLVGLDPAPLLADAESRLPHNVRASPELPPSADIPFPVGRPVRWRLYVLVALVLAVPTLLFELYREDLPEVTVNSRPAALPASSAGVSLPVQPVNTASSPAQIPKHVATPNIHVKVDPAASEHDLTFTFLREAWVEVRDGRGNKLLWQLNPAGTQQKVSGVPPLSLVIGNAGGVRLQIDDKLFNLDPYVDVDVARLTLE